MKNVLGMKRSAWNMSGRSLATLLFCGSLGAVSATPLSAIGKSACQSEDKQSIWYGSG